jgi:hypothetical protein
MKEAKRRNGYYYDLPNVPEGTGYPSVTTVLKILSRPQLTYWIKQMTAREAIRTLDEAKAINATNVIMENAGGEGTIAHELIDGYWKGEKYDISQKPEKVQQYLLAFEEFVKQHNPKVIETEGVVFSDTHKYAGAYDGLFEIAGETWLIDWKTSNGIYKEHKIQIIAYKKALEEMGKKVDKVAIVQLKNNGLPNTYMVGEQEDEVDVFDAFLCALKLYQVLDQLK